ncbi:acyl-CoA dehydrogenase [Sphingobium sp. 3R8]|uniref:acyl-CoA dehydrogenase n=1 Tax=Sphingobium sp. 3R8 TaxID=2874921 RepID=UPI001CD01A8F|nr:acyl-CoA dehydrogenase [Sphingobium sp. 3R8]MBZ9646887.1 acyl-CoA dehydrogenase [Sphingobium sp. 3R8]
MSLILSRRDLDFILYEWLKVETLTERPFFEHHDRQTFDQVLDTCEAMATDLFAPCYQAGDRIEPHFDGETVHCLPEIGKALNAFAETGLMSAGQSIERGGMQLPATIERAAFAWFTAANGPATGYAFLTMAAANLLVHHGTEEQIALYATPMLAGRFYGTMCLSEPQAGSSLSDVATRAEPQPDGTYRLSGNKMWTSGGEQNFSENIIHLLLARIPGGPPGVKGISLFIVPKFILDENGDPGARNDVALAGLNHKMGYRATTNTLLNFGEGRFTPADRPGAIGYLVGEPHQGLACMFFMMNEARIAVGTGAASLGYTGYLHALDYARNRLQGRSPDDKNPTTPQLPLTHHADVRRMLLAQKAIVEGALAFNLWCARLVDEAASASEDAARAEANLLLDLLTPVAKSWPSQFCLVANDLAIQVHGGYGYTRDFKVEQFYRDQRLNPIHEGTHGIQAIDLLGRKVVMAHGKALALFTARVEHTIDRAVAVGGDGAIYAEALSVILGRIIAVTKTLHAAGSAEATLANASLYLEAFGHLVIAWVWLEQFLVAKGLSGDFYEGKLQAARYFYSYELPRVGPILDLLAHNDRTPLDTAPAWL